MKADLERMQSVIAQWRSVAQMETYDRAYSLTDLEWLGGRICALTDVLALLEGDEVREPNVRKRLLGDDAVSHPHLNR